MARGLRRQLGRNRGTPGQAPVDRRDAAVTQVGGGAREVAAAEETAVRGQRRGVRRLQYQVALAVDQIPGNWSDAQHVAWVDSNNSLILHGLQLGAEFKY